MTRMLYAATLGRLVFMPATTEQETPMALANPGPRVRLPGIAHVAEGPLDLTTMYVMHSAFRRDLDRFVGAVEQTPVTDRTVWSALAARWDRFAEVLHHHHTIEDDTIWPRLLARVDAAGDREGRATLAAMEAEHAYLDPLLDACATGLQALAVRGDEDVRAALGVRLVATREGLGRHLAHEEEAALPLAQRHLPAAEWAAAEEAARRSTSARQLAFLVPWAADGLSGSARQHAFGGAGLAVRLLWLVTRGRYARADRLAFRYA
jgi:hemerythrin-like domain-containing protein